MKGSRKTSLWAPLALIVGLILALGLGALGAGPVAEAPEGAGDTSFQTTLLSPVEDTTLNSWFPTTNYGSQWNMALRSSDVSSPILQFDLTAIPSSGVSVAAATLRLYVESRTNAQPLRAGAAKVNRAWSASQATWVKANGSTNWATAGCNAVTADREAQAPLSVVDLPPAGWVDFDVTDMARAWVASPATNFGVVLKSMAGSSVGYTLASVNNANVAVRPVLRVVWGQSVSPEPTTPSPTLTPSPTPLPYVQVEKRGPAGPLVSGVPTQITYTVVVTNPWTGPITNVEVKDVLPLGTRYISCTGDGAYDEETRSVTWKIAEMAADEARTYEIVAELETYVKDGIIINLVQGTCDNCSGRARDHWPIAVVLPTVSPTPVTETPTVTVEPTITVTETLPAARTLRLVLVFKEGVLQR